MLKNIAKILTILVFLVFVAGAAFFYGEKNVASVKEYSLVTFYATGGVISLLVFFLLVKVVRKSLSTKFTPEEREAREYWKANLQRVRNSKLASLGNPFRRYPSFLLIRNRGGNEFGHGVPAMGEEYRQDLPNILVGDSLFLVDFPYERIWEFLGCVKSLGKANIKGVLIEDSEPSIMDKDDLVSLVKYINTHSVGRTLPVYVFVPDKGNIRALRDDGSMVSRALKMAPFGCFCDPIGTDRSIETAKQLLLQNLAILRNYDLKHFQELAQRHSGFWKNIEDALDKASSRFKSLAVSHGINMRALFYGEGLITGRPEDGISIQRVLLGDIATVDRLNRTGYSLMPQIGYLIGLLVLGLWMSYSFVQGKENLTMLKEQFVLEDSISDFSENLSHYRSYISRVDEIAEGLQDIFGISDDIRLKMKEKYVSQYEAFLVKPYIEMLKASRSSSKSPDSNVEQIAALLDAVKFTEGGSDNTQLDSSLLLKKMVELHTVIVDDTMMQYTDVTFRKYVEWAGVDDRSDLNNELRELLLDLYMTASPDSNSFVSFLKIRTKFNDIRIKNSATFPKEENSIYVSGVFSYPAISELNSLIFELEQVSEDSDFRKLIEQQKSDYFRAYDLAWKKAFLKAVNVVNTLDASSLESGLVHLAKSSSLFNHILSVYKDNLAEIPDTGDRENSAFVQDLVAWQRLMDSDYRKQLMSNGLLSGISDRSAIAVKKIKNIMESGNDEEARYKLEKSVLALIMQRESLIAEIAKVSLGEEILSFNSVMASYAEAKKSTSSSMPKESINRLLWLDQKILNTWSYQTSSDTGVKDLLAAESGYLIKGIMLQSGKYIQNKWQSNVLFELSNSSGWNKSKLISGRDGLVWKFKKEYLEPFVKSSGNRRYVEREIAGVKLGLSESMLSLLGKGSLDEQLLEEDLNIVISTLPTSVNRSAVELPALTTLELSCAKGRQRIENENFPLDVIFHWTPGGCSDVELKVFFGNEFVEKKYSGYAGMIGFFRDFREGKRQFSLADFPGSEELFSALNLKNITVRFRIKSSVSIDNLVSLASMNVPEQIIKGAGGDIYASI